jgi:energy-coupling factor transporter ATP-binding protein EcfA2/energy-coupling factor transporter transmembrane protein EcfT
MPLTAERLSAAVAGGSKPLIQDVHLALDDGTVTLLVGQTGAGKSTLLDLLCGLRRPDTGHVYYDGAPLWLGRRLNPTVQRRLGVVFQSPEQQLFANSVLGEFRYSLRPLRLPHAEVLARARVALQHVGLDEEVLGQSPLTLSGGQKRRVAVATTIAYDPDWLFLDEPTAGLDPAATRTLMDWLITWREGRRHGGMVIATHDLDTLLPLADQVVVLAEGRIVAQMTVSELWQYPEALTAAGVGQPDTIQLATRLRRLGIAAPASPAVDDVAKAIGEWLDAQEASHAEGSTIEDAVSDRINDVVSGAMDDAPCGCMDDEICSSMNDAAVDAGVTGATASQSYGEQVAAGQANNATLDVHPTPVERLGIAGRIRDLDPRAKWVSYILISGAILCQQGIIGYLASTALVLAVMAGAGLPRRQWTQVVQPLLVLMVLSALLSGLQVAAPSEWTAGVPHVGWLGFRGVAALDTLRQTYRFLLVMALGVVLPATTSPLRMKRGLEQSLRPLRRTGLPVEAMALAASLILRFIPVLLAELERFARIARARAKANPRSGGVRLRDLPSVVIPLLLSVLRLGDEFSLAMEARGYRLNSPGTDSIHLRMRVTDGWCLAASVGAALILLLLRLFGL